LHLCLSDRLRALHEARAALDHLRNRNPPDQAPDFIKRATLLRHSNIRLTLEGWTIDLACD